VQCMLQCVAVYVAVCCSVLQCAAVCVAVCCLNGDFLTFEMSVFQLPQGGGLRLRR